MYRAEMAEMRSKLVQMPHEPVNLKRSGYCKSCNQRKGGRRPEQTRDMQLLFVPYAPCLWEHFILSARGILADQMDFLAARLPRHSRILN